MDDSLVWTESELQLLETLTDLKAKKAYERVNLECVKDKCAQILSIFVSNLSQEGSREYGGNFSILEFFKYLNVLRNTEHQQNSGTPQDSGGTPWNISRTPWNTTRTPMEHQQNTPEQQNHTKQRTIVVILKRI